jgi:hypothetical protein
VRTSHFLYSEEFILAKERYFNAILTGRTMTQKAPMKVSRVLLIENYLRLWG